MVKIKIEDIIFLIFIIIVVGTALWLLHGSPQESSAIVTVGLAFAGSELLIWRNLFKVDKNTAVGFTKIKGELNNINYKLNEINNKLN